MGTQKERARARASERRAGDLIARRGARSACTIADAVYYERDC